MSNKSNGKALTQKHKNNEMFKELIQKQRQNIPNDKKLQLNDLKRICKYINSSIFDKNSCCIWSGYITNKNNSTKGTYINFYFRMKKVALHRLLYSNFVDDLNVDEYLKFNCDNKGMCCNIHHLKKFKYQKKNKSSGEESYQKSKDSKNKNYITVINNNCSSEELKKKLYLTFN